jgi:hypothetical protein
MRSQGRYQQFRHAFPEFFTPGIQMRRGGLRAQRFCVQLFDTRPLWTASAAAGLTGLLLSVVLFFLPGAEEKGAAREETALLNVPSKLAGTNSAEIPLDQETPASDPLFPEPSLTLPRPVQLPSLRANWRRLSMPQGWNDSRMATVRSQPMPPAQTPSLFLAPADDRWAAFAPRSPEIPAGHVPYREPDGIRDWEPITPRVVVSDAVSAAEGVQARTTPAVLVEKVQAGSASPDRLLRYEILVSNPTDAPIPDLTVFESIDVTRVTQTEPPARVEPTGLEWRLGGLAAGEQRRLVVHAAVRGLEALATTTEVTAAERIAALALVEVETPFFPAAEPIENLPPAQNSPFFPSPSELPPFPTLPEESPAPARPEPLPPHTTDARPVPMPELKLTVRPPQNAEVGADVVTWYEISNVGDAPAESVVLTVNLPEGLVHHDGQRQVKHIIPAIKPGETRRARLVTRVDAAGIFAISGELASDGMVETSRVELIALESAPPWPGSSMRVQPPEQQILPSQYTVESEWKSSELDAPLR